MIYNVNYQYQIVKKNLLVKVKNELRAFLESLRPPVSRSYTIMSVAKRPHGFQTMLEGWKMDLQIPWTTFHGLWDTFLGKVMK